MNHFNLKILMKMQQASSSYHWKSCLQKEWH